MASAVQMNKPALILVCCLLFVALASWIRSAPPTAPSTTTTKHVFPQRQAKDMHHNTHMGVTRTALGDVAPYRLLKHGECHRTEGTDHLRSLADCNAAAAHFGLADAMTPKAAQIDSDLIQHGCYFKARTATYYANFLNHTDEFYHRTEQRLYFNIGGRATDTAEEKASKALIPQHPHEQNSTLGNATRVALCKEVLVCPHDRQGRTCDDWIHSSPRLQYSCDTLEKFGLSCNGCHECNLSESVKHEKRHHNNPCGDDPRLHCRFEKSRHRFSQYSQEANENNKSGKIVRVVAVGDTHGKHDEIGLVPPGDVFIHTGDFTSGATTDPDLVRHEIAAFDDWIRRLPHKHKYFVCGNHDSDGGVGVVNVGHLVSGATYLLDSVEGVDVDGDGYPELKIWGTPWQPQFSGFATFVPEQNLADRWKSISSDVDILITHSPPRGHGDVNENKESVGSTTLEEVIASTRPLLNLFGHIHPGRTDSRVDETKLTPLEVSNESPTLFVNVAAANGLGSQSPLRRAVVIDINIKS